VDYFKCNTSQWLPIEAWFHKLITLRLSWCIIFSIIFWNGLSYSLPFHETLFISKALWEARLCESVVLILKVYSFPNYFIFYFSTALSIYRSCLYTRTWTHTCTLLIPCTCMQIYFCLRTGYYDEARNVAQSSRVAHQFAPQVKFFPSGCLTSIIILIVKNIAYFPSKWTAT